MILFICKLMFLFLLQNVFDEMLLYVYGLFVRYLFFDFGDLEYGNFQLLVECDVFDDFKEEFEGLLLLFIMKKNVVLFVCVLEG